MAKLAKTVDQALKAIGDREGKYLTFTLAGEEYGIGILKVREIIGIMPITTIPRTPGFVKGVINPRGKVIPLMDLGLKFGMEETGLHGADLHHRGGDRRSRGLRVDPDRSGRSIRGIEH